MLSPPPVTGDQVIVASIVAGTSVHAGGGSVVGTSSLLVFTAVSDKSSSPRF